MKYSNDQEYNAAILDEIESQSQGNEARAVELRRDFALERCMARFDAAQVAVIGGFGVRTIISPSPLTTDIDVLLNQPEWHGLDKKAMATLGAQYIVDAITSANEDRFQFNLSSWAHITDLQPDRAVGKIYLQVRIGEISFSAMQIDFGIKPDETPVERHAGRDVLAFAGVSNPIITTASREYLAADKISLLLEQGTERPRDLVHAALLLEDGKFDFDVLLPWLKKLAKRRNVEQKLTTGLPQPAAEWTGLADQITKRYRIALSGQDCYDRVARVLAKL